MMIRKGMFIGDRYEVIDKVGSGGMSDVYKAKDHKLNRNVAIKVLKSEFSDDKNFVSKFKIEAQSAAGLSHPNIVNVYDVGEDDSLYYIVMELIEGITLKKYIEKKGKLAVREAVSIAIQVAQGIEAAHNNHIIHRDIKPQNIIISREGKVKVTDFGIARAASANTINSNAMGSVHYISPEQARGGYIDEKSDIYSLGISLFEMITGRVPFEGDSTVQIALAHIQEEMPDPRKYVDELPISVVRIIEKCTQKKSDRRYLKVSSLIADLKKSLSNPDEDFVVIAPPINNGSTIMITNDEISVIRKEAELKAEADKQAAKEANADNDIDEFDEDEEYEEYDEDEEYEDEEEYEEYDDEDEDVFGDEDGDDSNPKLDKVVFFSAIVAAVIILIIAVLIVTQVTGGCGGSTPSDNNEQTTTMDSKSTVVPNVIDQEKDLAIEELKKAGLGYKIESVNHNTIEKNHVVKLSEDVGAVVARGTTITVTISDGAEPFDIPKVVGLSKDEAKEKLEGDPYGLKVEIEFKESDEAEDTVLETNPKAPTQLQYGDKITLIISQGKDTSDVQVPSLLNKTEEEAREELEKLNLSLVVEQQAYSDTIEAGKIMAQGYQEGQTVTRGTVVSVTVSLGSEGIEVPSFRGMTLAQARKTAKQKKINVEDQDGYIFDESIPKGSVIKQEIEAGTKVAEGTTIRIWVSLGPEPTTTVSQVETTTQEETTTVSNDPTSVKVTFPAFSVNLSETTGTVSAVLSYVNSRGATITYSVTDQLSADFATTGSQKTPIVFEEDGNYKDTYVMLALYDESGKVLYSTNASFQ